MHHGYTHGTHPCGRCHAKRKSTTYHEDRWRLEHWPAYWGASEPDTLVLGFSMGARQVAAARSKEFEQVAFDTHRHKLERILNALGIRRHGQSIDVTMTRWSRSLGYSSLARCSLGLRGPGEQDYKTSGTIMKVAPSDPWASEVLKRCASTYLTTLPASVKRVVLSGSSDAYVAGVRDLLRQIFEDFSDINPVSFRANGCTWVFAVHPSRLNRVDAWIDEPSTGVAGRKRAWTQAAIARSYEAEDMRPSRIGTKRVFKRSDEQARVAAGRG